MSKPNGAILYRGPSLLDGSPIVAIATGLRGKSANAKTGAMVQTWILRTDISPVDAVRQGADASICGDCKHRGVRTDDNLAWAKPRTCYVTVVQAPRSVYAAFRRGVYPTMAASDVAAIVDGRAVRLGAYGDPAAVPVDVWRALLSTSLKWTGYTHQWRTALDLQALCMASVDNHAEYMQARAAGWRTFRVRADFEALAPREIICPASHERPLTDCATCGLCNGARVDDKRATIAIIAHGTGAQSFVSLQSLKRA